MNSIATRLSSYLVDEPTVAAIYATAAVDIYLGPLSTSARIATFIGGRFLLHGTNVEILTIAGLCATVVVDTYLDPLSTSAKIATIIGGQFLAHGAIAVANKCLESIAEYRFKRDIDNWCNEEIGTDEHANRLVAAERIKKCYTDKGTTLDLSALDLTSLPESIGQLQKLQALSLFHNNLTEIPESIGQLHALQQLSLSMNQLYLSAIPESIGQLHALQELSLQFNHLDAIPESIGQLQKLQRLLLYHNDFTDLPLGIFTLPRDCIVDVTDCPFTDAAREGIRDRIAGADYQGPSINLSLSQPVIPFNFLVIPALPILDDEEQPDPGPNMDIQRVNPKSWVKHISVTTDVNELKRS